MPAPTSPPLPRAVAGRVSPTTLRTSAAEVSSGSSPPNAPERRRWRVLALLGAPVFIAGAVAVYVVGDRLFLDEPERRPVARPVAADEDEPEAPTDEPTAGKSFARFAATASARTAADAPASAAPTPTTSTGASGAVSASAPRTVILRVESVPSPADVIDLPSGKRLGETPYELEVALGAPRPRIRLTLKGHAPAEATLATDRSDTTVVKLRPRKGVRIAPSPPKPKPID
jgi:hypothetical protein